MWRYRGCHLLRCGYLRWIEESYNKVRVLYVGYGIVCGYRVTNGMLNEESPLYHYI